MKYEQKIVSLMISATVILAVIGCSSSDDNPAPASTLGDGSGDGSTADGSGSTPDTPPTTAFSQPTSYSGFPVTLKDAEGETSVSYKGQMARHVLRESAKEAMKTPSTSSYAVIGEINTYLKNENNVIDDAPIKAPVSKDEFIIKETVNNELGTEKDLYGKLFDAEGNGDPIPGVAGADKAKTLGVPGGKTAKEVVNLWVGHFGADHAGHLDGEADHHDLKHGYDYRQLLPKYLMGAVFYSESVNHYLDENLEPGTKDNDKPYKEGKHYTGKEHSWDEGFGYFGAAAHYGERSAEENYEINKMGKKKTAAEALALADKDGDGKVSLYTEYNSGPAYYAASFDKDGKSTYGKDIMDGWLQGRTIITNAVDAEGHARKLNADERNQLKTLGSTIQHNWEAVFAEAVFKYAGESFEEIEKLEAGTSSDPKKYYSVWSEMKGFMLALQYGGANSKIDKTTFEEIDNLIGFGPVQPNGKQVNGIEAGENAESFTLGSGNTLEDYKANMLEVQKKIDAFYGLKAKQHSHLS